MNPARAVTWGPFIQAAYDQFASGPGHSNPAAIKNMPADYTLVRTIQMSDFFGPGQSRVFYGFAAVGGWRSSDTVTDGTSGGRCQIECRLVVLFSGFVRGS